MTVVASGTRAVCHRGYQWSDHKSELAAYRALGGNEELIGIVSRASVEGPHYLSPKIFCAMPACLTTPCAAVGLHTCRPLSYMHVVPVLMDVI